MAAYREGEDFLVGDELEEYLDAFIDDNIETNESTSGMDDIERIEGTVRMNEIVCSCGKPAIQRTAKCNIIHYTCGSDGQNRAIVDEIDLCDCCKFMPLQEKDTNEEMTSGPMDIDKSVAEHSSPHHLPAPPVQSKPSTMKTNTEPSLKTANTQKKKGPASRPMIYSEEHAKQDIPRFFHNSMEQVKSHPIYGRSCFKGSKAVLSLASNVINKRGTEEHTKFEGQLTALMWKCMSSAGNKVGGAAEDALCRGLLEIRDNEGLRNLWITLCGADEDESTCRHLLLHLIRQTFTDLIKLRNDTDLPSQKLQADIDLPEHDEQVLRYASGYIPFVLIKQYNRQNNPRANALKAFLQTWKVSADHENDQVETFLQYTKKWVEKVNRGNLFTYNDSVYKFFRAMEIECRKTLTKEAMMCPDLYTLLVNKLDENIYIPRLWESLVKDQLPRAYSDHLLYIVKLKFAKMRVTAYITVYFMFRQIQNRSISRKGEKALRKELVQST